MTHLALRIAAMALLASSASGAALAAGPSDPQIARVAYLARALDIAAGNHALARSHNKEVRAFAAEMVRDHDAVNVKALGLVTHLRMK